MMTFPLRVFTGRVNLPNMAALATAAFVANTQESHG